MSNFCTQFLNLKAFLIEPFPENSHCSLLTLRIGISWDFVEKDKLKDYNWQLNKNLTSYLVT